MRKQIFIIGILIIIWGCSTIIPSFAPKKEGKLSHSELTMEADTYFWDNFHQGNYDSIPKILDKLMTSYSKNNNDYKIAAHIGFTHAWALAESNRIENVSPRITDHSTLAVKYFKEAFELHPEKEWRYYGFMISMYMAEGGIHADMQDMTEGYFKMKKAVRKYPEFNLFTAAYTLAMSPREKDRKAAIEMLWENLDKCVGEKVSRKNLDYRKYLSQKKLEGKKRTCWNTWITPHNMEGFLMILGDLLIKKGDFDTALMVYENTKYFQEYEHWDYKYHLETRIEATKEAIALKKQYADIKLMKFDRCMVCHQDKSMNLSPSDVHIKLPSMLVADHLEK
jgi:hypothetical protein